MQLVTKILTAAGLTAGIALGQLALAQEAAPQPAQPAAPAAAAAPEVVKSGSWSMPLPLGLQAGSAYIPDDNPITEDKIVLWKFLYFDPRLSKDKTIACASCHNPFHGFADPARTSKGVGGKAAGPGRARPPLHGSPAAGPPSIRAHRPGSSRP